MESTTALAVWFINYLSGVGPDLQLIVLQDSLPLMLGEGFYWKGTYFPGKLLYGEEALSYDQ